MIHQNITKFSKRKKEKQKMLRVGLPCNLFLFLFMLLILKIEFSSMVSGYILGAQYKCCALALLVRTENLYALT